MNQQQQWTPTSVFVVEGVVVRDAFQGPTFSYVTLREGEKSYWDVACFEDGPLNEFRSLRGGAVARIRGHLGKRKIKEQNGDPNARARYEIQLVATAIKALAPVVPVAPPQPPQHRQMSYEQWLAMQGPAPAYTPPSAARANHPNPAWPDPNQPNLPPQVTQAQAGAEHPAAFDGADGDLPF